MGGVLTQLCSTNGSSSLQFESASSYTSFPDVQSASSYTSSPDVDFRELKFNQLDKFIAQQLQPNQDFNNLVSTALDNLYHYLQHSMRLPSLRRLIKGGSMGKGTALKDNSDLDCVLIMNDICDAEELIEQIQSILNQLCDRLKEDPLAAQGWEIEIKRQNRFMVQIEMHNVWLGKSVEVDLLPTFDADVKNDYSRNDLYQLMSTYDDDTQQFCSAALAELKRKFLKSMPPKLKDLIRLVKHWCKRYLQCKNGQHIPNSYLLELITIKVWQNEESPHGFKTASLFKKVMTALYNHRKLDITWDCYYHPSMIKATSTPRVVDPVNPHSNVYDIVSVRGWKRVRKVAGETLNKPLLQGL